MFCFFSHAVVSAVNAILAVDDGACNTQIGDVNSDGQLDVLDVVTMVNGILAV